MSTEDVKDGRSEQGVADEASVSETLPVPPSLQEARSAKDINDDHPQEASVPRDFFILPVPRRLRHDSKDPSNNFNIFINIVFALATTFIVANLYWCQPILIELSKAFDVSYERVSNVPTLLQGGYATGLLLIAPLGDLVRRRSLILGLALLSTGLTFGLAFTNSFVAFEVLSFIIGAVSCTPQILVPLAADLAPPHRRASAISIVVSGLLFGILIARVVSGLIAEFVTWRAVYYLAIGLQGLVFFMLYFLMPDFPVRNTDITYLGILWSMLKFSVTEPVLIQASLVSLASMACFTNFWVTLTFLLGGPPYNYSTLVIGLFGLVGMFGVICAPIIGRLVDSLIPWVATVFATIGLLLFQGVQTGAGGVNIAAVVIVCFGIDVTRQMQQVSLTTAVFELDPKARSRLNSVILVAVFIGQIMGTAVGTEVFVKYGWRPAAALSVAWTGFTLIIMLIRGPHCARYTWFGYEGGLKLTKAPHPAPVTQDEEKVVGESVAGTEGDEKDSDDDI